MQEFMLELLTYHSTGLAKCVETFMIFLLVAFIAWNVKLFLEKDEGE